MAAYDTLRAAIDNYIKANGNNEITGTVLNDILNAMVSALGADTRFAGVAVPSTNPGNPEGNVIYFASQAGTYSNFSGIVLPLGIHILVWNGMAWTSQTWFSVDNTPTQNSQNLATSGGILQAIVDAVGVERLRAIGVEVTSASFDSTTKKISFFNSANSTLFQLDATAFVIDGMVSDVKIEDGNLVIQFNTDAGKQDIEIPLTDIFNPANYYTKAAIDALLVSYYTKTETDALLASYYTKIAIDTLLTSYYTKTETDSLLASYYNKTAIDEMLTVINNKLADGYLYRGMAEPTTNPTTPTTKVFYIATKAGTYTNFGNIAVTEGITILKYDGSNWSKEQISYSDGVFDISAYHATGGTLAKYADLAAALDSNNGGGVPQSLQKGGMSVKYVQSSDNKYMQWRFLLSGSFTAAQFTNTANWQGVDTEPTSGSMNLITSGGVQASINDIEMYNVTEKNSGTKYSSLSDAIQAIPTSDRKTNMCIKYMNTSNLFVRYTYMKDYSNNTTGNNNFLNVANWQGISDEVPTAGSHNAVESGTIFNEIKGLAKKTDSVVCGGSGLITQSGNTIKIANSTFLYNVGVASYYIKFHASALYVEYTISYGNCLVLDVSKIDTTKTSANNPSVASEISGLISVINRANITKDHIILVGNNYGKVYGALARWKIDFDEKFNRVFDSIRVVAPVYSDRNGHVKIPSLYLPELSAEINHENGISTLGKSNYIEFDLQATISNSCIYLDLSKFYYENNSVLNSIVTRSAYIVDAYNSGLVLLLARNKNNINGWPSYKGCLSSYVVFEDSLTVFNRYGEQFNSLNYLTKKGYRSSKNNLSFGWISDGHDNTLFDANVAVDNSPADFLVYTGDMSLTDYSSPVDTLISEAVAMTKPAYFVIGNHDHWKAPSLDALYDRWISPLATKDGITTRELYYSIDFSAKGVKCIFLNDVDVAPSNTNYMYSVYSQTQIEWLVSELKNAATNNLHVAIFRHYPAFNGTVENEVWTERHFKSSLTFEDNEVKTPDSNGVSSWNPIPYIIKAWVDKDVYTSTYNGFTISADFSNETNNGIFIGYFNGHTHGDSVIKNTTLNQLNIGITQPNTYQERTDLWKNANYYHEINFVQIDTNNREIHIMRLGQRNTYNSYVRDFLCVGY